MFAKCIQSINRCHYVTHAEIMQVTLQGRLIKLHFELNYDNLIVNKTVVFLFHRILFTWFGIKKVKDAN